MGSIDPLIFLQIGILFSILLIGFEWILRNAGVKPSKAKSTKSKITPEGTFYKEHSVLGFVHQEGNYHLNINDGDFVFSAKHDSDGHRVTKLENSPVDIDQEYPEIWIFGCSFIYGWLVEDHETFPWLLQTQLTNYKITNFAISGYGTLQSYLQFQQALKSGRHPDIAMIFYGSKLHDPRNAFTRSRKKAFTRLDRISPFKVPAGRLDQNGNLDVKYDRIKYRGLPLISQSAFTNYMDDKLNKYLDGKLNSFKVSKKILANFNQLCQKNNITFVVGGILQDKSTRIMLDYCKKLGAKTVDISVDRSPEHVHDYDFHPSPLAHQKYTDKMIKFLKNERIVTEL